MAPKRNQKKLDRVVFLGLGSCESLTKQLIRPRKKKRRKKNQHCKLNVCKNCVADMIKNNQLKGKSFLMEFQKTSLVTHEQKIERVAPSSPAFIDLCHSDDEDIKKYQIIPETSDDDGIIVLSSQGIKGTQILSETSVYSQEDAITSLSSTCIRNKQNVSETSVNGEDDGITVLSSTTSNCLDDSVIFVEEVTPKAKPFSKQYTVVGNAIGKRGAQNKRKRDEEKENPRKIGNVDSSESRTLSVEELLGPLIRPLPTSQNLRPIVIDGSNVARSHGRKTGTFSCRGIALCISYFQGRGHTQVTALVPQFRRNFYQGQDKITDQWMLETLSRSQLVVFTPSRPLHGKIVASYDDRFIVDLACQNGGVIISNDYFRDVAQERADWRATIEQRLLMYCFVGDVFMVPQDPCGRRGPKLLQFLSFPKG